MSTGRLETKTLERKRDNNSNICAITKLSSLSSYFSQTEFSTHYFYIHHDICTAFQTTMWNVFTEELTFNSELEPVL